MRAQIDKPLASAAATMHRATTALQAMADHSQRSERLNTLRNLAAHSPQSQRIAQRQALAAGTAVVQRELGVEEYQQVKSLALEIMRRYPPEQYHYLGLGKSPTPVMAFLQEYGENPDISASNMPLSKFGHPTGSMSSAERQVVDGQPLDEEQRQRLWEHFDRFVPGPGDLEGKSILLIDLVQTGKSLVATQRHLQEYLSERYHGTGATGLMFGALSMLSCFPSAPKVGALALAIEEQQQGGTKKVMDSLGLSATALMIPGKLGEEGSLAARMGGEKYKPQAEYPHDFKISANDRPKTGDIVRDPQEHYKELREAFARYLSADEPVVRLMEGGSGVQSVRESVDESERLLSMDKID